MSDATVIYVAYGVKTLDLAWLPDDVPVILVHNDDQLDRSLLSDARVVHLGDGSNIGFGAAVNLALPVVETPRVILSNPDTSLCPDHFAALVDADPRELVTIPLIEESGTANSVVNPYWNVVSFVATAHRLGRLVPRGGRARRFVAPLLGAWGRGHVESLDSRTGSWPLSQRWASAAVLSVPTDALRAVDGFDDGYFLYYEDTDLQQRLAAHDETLSIRLADVAPGVHSVGGSVDSAAADGQAAVARIRQSSARRYADRQEGPAWRIAARLVGAGASGVEQ